MNLGTRPTAEEIKGYPLDLLAHLAARTPVTQHQAHRRGEHAKGQQGRITHPASATQGCPSSPNGLRAPRAPPEAQE